MIIYELQGAKNVGWFNKEELYKVAENFHAAVYTFAFCETKPQQDLWPHEIENSFYVGQSGTERGEHWFYDQKIRKNMGTYLAPKYGRYTSLLKMRMKAHHKEFLKYRDEQETKYKLFHDTFTPSLRPNYQVYCNLMIPSDDLEPFLTKSWLLMIEATVIYCYNFKWKNNILCNLANATNQNKRDPNSISNFNLVSAKNGDLSKFMEEENEQSI